MKSGNITANEVLIVGGVVALAYVIYSGKSFFEGIGSGISNAASSAKNALSDAYVGTENAAASGVDSVKNGLNSAASYLDIRGTVSIPSAVKNSTFYRSAGDFAANVIDSIMPKTNNASVGASVSDPANQTSPNLSFSNLTAHDPVSAFSNPAQNPIFYGDGLSLTAPNGPTFN